MLYKTILIIIMINTGDLKDKIKKQQQQKIQNGTKILNKNTW